MYAHAHNAHGRSGGWRPSDSQLLPAACEEQKDPGRWLKMLLGDKAAAIKHNMV